MRNSVPERVPTGCGGALRTMPARIDSLRRGVLVWGVRKRTAEPGSSAQVRRLADAGAGAGAEDGAGGSAPVPVRRDRTGAASLDEAVAPRVQPGGTAGGGSGAELECTDAKAAAAGAPGACASGVVGGRAAQEHRRDVRVVSRGRRRGSGCVVGGRCIHHGGHGLCLRRGLEARRRETSSSLDAGASGPPARGDGRHSAGARTVTCFFRSVNEWQVSTECIDQCWC